MDTLAGVKPINWVQLAIPQSLLVTLPNSVSGAARLFLERRDTSEAIWDQWDRIRLCTRVNDESSLVFSCLGNVNVWYRRQIHFEFLLKQNVCL